MRLRTRMDAKKLYQQLGGFIRQRRRALDLTQEELATQLGISRGALANIEGGRQNMLLHQLYRIASALDLDVHQLLPAMDEAQPEASGIRLPKGLTPEQEAQVTRLMTGETSRRP